MVSELVRVIIPKPIRPPLDDLVHPCRHPFILIRQDGFIAIRLIYVPRSEDDSIMPNRRWTWFEVVGLAQRVGRHLIEARRGISKRSESRMPRACCFTVLLGDTHHRRLLIRMSHLVRQYVPQPSTQRGICVIHERCAARRQLSVTHPPQTLISLWKRSSQRISSMSLELFRTYLTTICFITRIDGISASRRRQYTRLSN